MVEHLCLAFSLCYTRMQPALPQLKNGTWFNNGDRRTKVTQYHTVVHAVTGLRSLSEFARLVNVVSQITHDCLPHRTVFTHKSAAVCHTLFISSQLSIRQVCMKTTAC